VHVVFVTYSITGGVALGVGSSEEIHATVASTKHPVMIFQGAPAMPEANTRAEEEEAHMGGERRVSMHAKAITHDSIASVWNVRHTGASTSSQVPSVGTLAHRGVVRWPPDPTRSPRIPRRC